nr:hypothetical protein [Nanoarchaeum sp.]
MNKKNFLYVPVTIFLSIVIYSNILPQDKWKGEKKIIDGVSHVYNSNIGMKPDHKVKFIKALEIGLDEGDDKYIFGKILAIDVDKEGKIYVLDFITCNVRTYSRDGKYVKTISRPGNGPGELKNPIGMALTKNNVLIVGESMTKNLTIFDSNGNYVNNINTAESLISDFNLIDENDILYPNSSVGNNKDKLFMKYGLSIIDLHGKNITDIFSMHKEVKPGKKEITEEEGNNFLWCNDSEGRIFIAENNYQYEIKIFNQRGNLTKVIHKHFKPIKRTEKDLKKLQNETEEIKMISGAMMDIKIKFSENNPIIYSMFTDDNDRLWVVTPEGSPDDGLAFDIFDREGKFITKTTCDIKATGSFLIKDGSIYFVNQSWETFPIIYKLNIIERR